MPLNASKFIKNRKVAISVTTERITHILWYIAECYKRLLLDKPLYSKTYVKTKTSYHFEDYLKMELVDSYLIPNKTLLISKLSSLDEINFTYETIKRFTDTSDGKEKSDKIDVYINKIGLKNEWQVEDEHLYIAIECKRIGALANCKDYIDDIQKFCDREHKHLRIPFEGQIAFIENKELSTDTVSNEINVRLKATTSINTIKYLAYCSLHNSFKSSYSSIHKRNYKQRERFTIFHLLFDYSGLVVN